MPTKNLQVIITFEKAYAELLASLAKKQNKSVAALSKQLRLEALEQHEDSVLSKIAEKRETDDTCEPLSPKVAWQEDVWN